MGALARSPAIFAFFASLREMNSSVESVQSVASSYRSVNMLGVRVDAVTYSDVLDIITRWIEQRGPHQIATANPEFVMAAQADGEFRQTLLNADLCVADGVGLLWAARRLGTQLPERVTGSDLTPLVAQAAAQRGWRLK